MSKAKHVLVISGTEDPMWPFLQEACEGSEKELLKLFSTSDPQTNQCSYDPVQSSVQFKIMDQIIKGENICGVWWRRMPSPNLAHLEPGLANYCTKEQLQFLEGLEHVLTKARWVSKPSAIARAQNKALQLRTAKELRLIIPTTIFTNSPSDARSYASANRSIYKAVKSPRIPLKKDRHSTVFTTEITEKYIQQLDGLMTCPGIIQEMCQKQSDIRVTVLNGMTFSAEIKSQEGDKSKTDFRKGARYLPHLIHTLPDQIEQACINLVKKLGLEFGAIDLALMKDGSYVFFEINPNGQWGWLEQKTGLPMRRALLNYLFHKQRDA